jgi:hypothetical protein
MSEEERYRNSNWERRKLTKRRKRTRQKFLPGKRNLIGSFEHSQENCQPYAADGRNRSLPKSEGPAEGSPTTERLFHASRGTQAEQELALFASLCAPRSRQPRRHAMTQQEYDDYRPEHPHLIPTGEEDATSLILAAQTTGLTRCSRDQFLGGWWALCWLNPGLHPDDCDDWTPDLKAFADEAFRRHELGEISDSELYPVEASHNRIWVEQLV